MRVWPCSHLSAPAGPFCTARRTSSCAVVCRCGGAVACIAREQERKRLVAHTALDTLADQRGLDALADPLSTAVHGAYDSAGDAGRAAKNAMHGVWLGHPLHPVLTDIPLGAWTTALVFDAAERATG